MGLKLVVEELAYIARPQFGDIDGVAAESWTQQPACNA
jgi:hypothetical protein